MKTGQRVRLRKPLNGLLVGQAGTIAGFYWQLETAVVLFDGQPTGTEVPLDALDVIDNQQPVKPTAPPRRQAAPAEGSQGVVPRGSGMSGQEIPDGKGAPVRIRDARKGVRELDLTDAGAE
jgi:hypothetical protein